MGIASCLDLLLVGDGLTDRELRRELMNWQRRLAALFVVLALAGCAPGNRGQAGARYTPYSPAHNESVPEHGGEDGGGGAGAM